MNKVSMASRTIEIDCEYFDNYILEYALSKSPIAEALYLAAESIINFYENISKTSKFEAPPFKPSGITGERLSINERGGEIVNLPDGSTVIPKEISESIVKGDFICKPVNTKLTTKHLKKAIKKIKKDLK